MELTETVESLNRQLSDLYGIDTVTGKSIFRIVWSEDQFEKRLMDVTDEGLQLLHPEVRLVPKYRQWITEKYVLERLVLVPGIQEKELAGVRQSYEPLWVFETNSHQYLPPKIQVCQIVVDSMYAAMGRSTLSKYVDDSQNPEKQAERIDKLTEEIFGNETNVSDHLSRQTGVVISNTDMREKN